MTYKIINYIIVTFDRAQGDRNDILFGFLRQCHPSGINHFPSDWRLLRKICKHHLQKLIKTMLNLTEKRFPYRNLHLYIVVRQCDLCFAGNFVDLF